MRARTMVLLLLLLVAAIPMVAIVGLWAIDPGFWRGVISRHVEEATGRKLEIAGPLSIGWGLEPVIAVEGLKLANADWAATPTMLEVPRLEVQIRLMSLLGGSAEFERLSLVDPTLELETAADGRQNWDLPTAAPAVPPTTGAESSLPVLREATIVNGTVRYRSGGSDRVTTIRLAQARLAGETSSTDATVEVEGDIAGSAIQASARLAQPSNLLFGTLAEVAISDLKARLGDTDLTGTAKLNWAGARTRLDADVASDRLDPATFIGLAGGGQTKDMPPAQSALAGLAALDADVRLRAGALVTHGLDTTKLDARAKLAAGRLEITPLRLELSGRPVTGSLMLDGGKQPAEVALNAVAESLEVGPVLAGLGATKLIEGPADVRAELRGHGGTPREWVASATGHVRLLMNGGQLSNQVVAGLAGGLRQLLGSLGGGRDGTTTSIKCVLADVPVDDGVARPDLILDTDYITLVAHGTVDLARERIDLTLSPHAKSVDLNVALPVTIRGPLRHPSYGIDETDAARRLISLLGSAIFPPAALGAFVDFGSAAGNDCLKTASRPPPAEPTTVERLGQQLEGAAKGLLDQLLPAQ